jgi:hypothetical protein
MPLHTLNELFHVDLIYLHLIKQLMNILFLNRSIFSRSEMIEKTKICSAWSSCIHLIVWLTLDACPSKERKRPFMEKDLIICTEMVLRWSRVGNMWSSKVTKKFNISILKGLTYLTSSNCHNFRLNIKKCYYGTFLQRFSSSFYSALFRLYFKLFWQFVLFIRA